MDGAEGREYDIASVVVVVVIYDVFAGVVAVIYDVIAVVVVMCYVVAIDCIVVHIEVVDGDVISSKGITITTITIIGMNFSITITTTITTTNYELCWVS